MVPLTHRLHFLVAVRPGLNEPDMSARMAPMLDRLSGGRLLINVVAGENPAELRGDGVWLDHDARYAATDKFLHIWRPLMQGETVDFRGKHMAIEGGKLRSAGAVALTAAVFRGSSAAGQAVADMAQKSDISKKFLNAILLDLRNAGMRRSKTGPGGGYALVKPAGTIKIGAVVRALDGPIAPVACASCSAHRLCENCTDVQTCTIRKLMTEVRMPWPGCWTTPALPT